jgi:cbb3-type cytochrome c oxidase subunit III
MRVSIENRIGVVSLLAAGMVLPACASTPTAEKTIEPTVTEDSSFVLSRNPTAAKPAERVPVHVGDQWWAFRADFLKVNEEKARDRDGDISEKQAPPGFWDLQTSVETISVWTTFCNECHGGRRKMEDVIKMPAPGPNWGKGDGLFFGIRRPYSEIFKTVYSGKIEKEGNRWKMPAWRGKLSKEQIWALIYFVEYQSGGIEGRFPPSLYPRENPEHQ